MDVGSIPFWATVDYANGWVYVPNLDSETVSIINGTTVVGTVHVGSEPYSATYDDSNQFVYVSNEGSSNVTVLSGTQVVTSVKTGSEPQHAAYDNANGWVYVPDEGISSVTVINGTSVVKNVTVGAEPVNATYDPQDGYVYVEDEGGDKVSVMNNTTVIASLTVGTEPWSGIYDVGNGYVYIVNEGSASVSVVNNTTVLATLHVGSFPEYGGYDGANGFVYVANEDSNNVSVINGTKIFGKVSTGDDPVVATFDPGNGDMYVPGSYYPYGTVDIINGTSVVTSVKDGEYARYAVFDAANGAVYVPNEDSDNVSVILGDSPVTFLETGLPSGTSWQVNLGDGATNMSTSDNLSFVLADGVYTYSVSTANLTFASPGGSFAVLGKALTVNVPFSIYTYRVSFSESGLPSGTRWSVTMGGILLNSTLLSPTVISIPEPNGTYAYSIGDVPGWTTLNYTGVVDVNGGAPDTAIAWTQTVYQVEFQEVGLRSGATWWVNLTNGGTANSTTNSLSVDEPNGTYNYTVDSSDKTYSASGDTFSVNGLVVARTIAFSRVTFAVTFNETGLPTGTSWSITIGGVVTSSTTTEIRLLEINGSYTYRVGGVPGWTTSAFSGSVQVQGGPVTTTLVWTPVTYSVTFTESGLPRGTEWSVSLGGTTNTSTVVIQFFGVTNGTVAYDVNAVAGYVAKPASGEVVVKGGPASQAIEFTPRAPVSTSPTPSPTFLGLPLGEGYGVLGGILVAIVVVIGVVALLMRRRRAPPAPEEMPAYEESLPPPEGEEFSPP